MDEKSTRLVNAKEGRAVSVAGGTYRFVASGSQTQGAYALIEMLIPPGGGPGPHAHGDFEEAFYVLEGEVEVGSEAGFRLAKAGDFVRIPKGGIVHQFKNTGVTAARLLCLAVPAGLELLFEEIGQPAEAGKLQPASPPGPADLARLKTAAEKHGQKLYPPDYLERFRKPDRA